MDFLHSYIIYGDIVDTPKKILLGSYEGYFSHCISNFLYKRYKVEIEYCKIYSIE